MTTEPDSSPPRYASPLRYPGGKGALFPVLADTIRTNGHIGCTYIEPFAGGAGAALRLLYSGIVDRIVLNDIDPNVMAAWRSMVDYTDRFLRRLNDIPVTIDEWKRQQDIYRDPNYYDDFDRGFATFYVNRCNRSGILRNGSAIGGLRQNGKWKLDARFNKRRLAERIWSIGQWRSKINLTCMHATDLICEVDRYVASSVKGFVYLDPPYYQRGAHLYLNSFTHHDHCCLADALRQLHSKMWVMTYDNHPAIRDIYNNQQVYQFDLPYSAQHRTMGHELFIAPCDIKISKLLNVRHGVRLR